MIDNISITDIPKTKPYLFADLAEMLILARYSNEISRSDLQSIIRDGLEEDVDMDVHSQDESDSIITDRDQRHIEECFDHLDYRKAAFSIAYPFVVEKDLLSLITQVEPNHKLYLFLLCCCQLGRFSNRNGIRQRCAGVFAKICKCAMQQMLPAQSKVWIFDANADDRRNYFGTNLRTALRKLAAEINERPAESVIDQLSTSGDGGIDLVGVLQFKDKALGHFTFFGQCAAKQIDWEYKILESSAFGRVGRYFHLMYATYNLFFSPLLYRQVDSHWYKESDVGGSVFIDRIRIIELLDNGSSIPTALLDEIDECLDSLGVSGAWQS